MPPRVDGRWCRGRWSAALARACTALAWAPLACTGMGASMAATARDDAQVAADDAAFERLAGALRLDRLSWRAAESRLDATASPEERAEVARALVRVIEPMIEGAPADVADLLAQRLLRILNQFPLVHADAAGLACASVLLDASAATIYRVRAGDLVSADDLGRAAALAARAEELASAVLLDLGDRGQPGFTDSLQSKIAWARLQQAWVASQGEGKTVAALAVAAMQPLAAVLDVESRSPKPEEVSVDLRSGEHYAWAIVGMAQSKALQPDAGAEDAMRWMDLVDDPITAATVRSAAMEWRLHLCIDAGDLKRARLLVSAGGALPPSAAPALARVARRCARERPRDPETERLIEVAVPSLLAVGRGDLVEWIAQALPSEGQSGLVGALAAVAAVSMDASAAPIQLRDAGERALVAAEGSRPAAARVLRTEAARLFLRAGDGLRAAALAKECLDAGRQGDGALWLLRIQALAAADQASLVAEVDEFLNARGADAWTARAALVAAEVGVRSDAVLLALEAVPQGDAMRARAQQALCVAAYDRMRTASPAERAPWAELVMRCEAPPTESWPDGAIDPIVLRQVATATLPWFRTPVTIAAADRLLGQVELRGGSVSISSAERTILAEATVRVAAAGGQPERALAALGALDGPSRDRAARAVIELVRDALRGDGVVGARRAALARAACDATRDASHPATDAPSALAWIEVATVAVRGGDASLGAESIARATQLVDRAADRPTLMVALQSARAAHDDEVAVGFATRLVAGLAADDPERLGVEVMLIDSLSRVEPARARQTLKQVLTLTPGWRTGSQGAPLQELAKRLGVDA